MKGYSTSFGSLLYKDDIPEENALIGLVKESFRRE
jgi:hypothetical protein